MSRLLDPGSQECVNRLPSHSGKERELLIQPQAVRWGPGDGQMQALLHGQHEIPWSRKGAGGRDAGVEEDKKRPAERL